MSRDPVPPELLPDTCRLMDRAEALAEARQLAGRCYQEQGVPMPAPLLDQAQRELTPVAPAPVPPSAMPAETPSSPAMDRDIKRAMIVVGGFTALLIVGLFPIHPSRRALSVSSPPPAVIPSPTPAPTALVPYHPLVLAGADQVEAGWTDRDHLLLRAPESTGFQPTGPITRRVVDEGWVLYTLPMESQVSALYKGKHVTLTIAQPVIAPPAQKQCQLNVNGQPITILNAPHVRVLDGDGNQMDVTCDTPDQEAPSS